MPNPAALTFRQINTAKSGAYTITKTYITDPKRSTVLIDVDVTARSEAQVFVFYDPSLNNSGWHDSGRFEADALVAVEKNVASALVSSCGFEKMRSDAELNNNLVQAVVLKQKRCTLALGFGETTNQAATNARSSLARGFARSETRI